MMEWINYYNQKQFLPITQNQDSISTDCTSIAFENKGDVDVYMTVSDVVILIKAGDGMAHSNDPDVLEKTYYQHITFDNSQSGQKYLLVTKEFVKPKSQI